MRPALLLAALLLAGCTTPPPAGDDAPAERVGHFTRDMMLVEAAPDDPAAIRTGSFFRAWATGADYPTWRAPPAARDVAVDNLTVELVVRVTGPVVETARFPDLMVYAGAGDAWMSINTTQTPPVLVPGQTYRYAFPIETPRGGLWVPAGQSFGLKVVPVMHQNDQADVEVLVGAADATRATWRETPVAAPAVASWTRGSDAGELTGSAYAGAATPASARHRVAIEVNATDAVLHAWMNTTENQGVPDLDLELVGPSGESLVFSGTPTPREEIRVAPFNLEGPGTYTLVAHNYGSARARFTLEWFLGSA